MKLKLKGAKPTSSFNDWYKKQKTKRATQRALVPKMLRLATFALTLVSMILGLSLLPLFPQPLPIIIAFLIAFGAYENPLYSLPVGGALIGLGLIYNLSTVNFISALGDQFAREVVVFAFLLVFTVLPIIFHKHMAAIAIDLGIIAAILLFFGQAYFLAVPLIFASIVVFKKLSVLTAVYYGLISTPLLMMQYLGFIIEAAKIQFDWWVLPNSSPPLFTPLTDILKNLQDSMIQFRLFDTSRVVYAISEQVTQIPPPAEHTITEVLSHYLDSIPGIVLFLVIIAVLVLATIFVMRLVLKAANVSERVLPPITAAVGTFAFFVCLLVLQGPLAFEAKIEVSKIAIGTIAAAMFALPAVYIDQSPKRGATVDMIAQKAKELLGKLENFEMILRKAQETLPVDLSSLEGKMLILKDKLNDTLYKTSNQVYEPSEIEGVFSELEALSKDIDSLNTELDVSLRAYHLLVEGEYSIWIGRFQDLGVQVNVVQRKSFQHELPVEERITRIKETIDAGESLANDVLEAAEQSYNLIREMFDPKLPEESRAVAFARRQLAENGNPWAASNSLFSAINNWKKQYKAEISLSLGYLQNSISFVGSLSDRSEVLRSELGKDYSKVMDLAKKAADLELDIEKDPVTPGNFIRAKYVLQASLNITRDVLVVLNERLGAIEKSIGNLLPNKDYLWEKKSALSEQIAFAASVLLKPSEHQPDQVLATLKQSVSYIENVLSAIAQYNFQEEILLNYPVAEIAIIDSLKQKSYISVHDLPFEPTIAENYLRIFYSKRFRDYSLDNQSMTLARAKN